MRERFGSFLRSTKGRVMTIVSTTAAVVVAGPAAAFAGEPPAPGSGVSEVYEAAQTELSGAVPLIVGGVAAILALAWVIRAVFIAQRAAKKASGQIGS